MPDIILNEREISPVRLLPFLSGWSQLSPDKIMSILAHDEKWYNINLCAYHLKPNNAYSLILPKEWDVIISDLSILSHSLKAKEKTTHDSYPEWRKQSIHCIPASTFVWMDEFQAAYSRVVAPHRTVIKNERPGDRELNTDPLLPHNLQSSIYEGFEALINQAQKTPKIISPDKHNVELNRERGRELTIKRNGLLQQRLNELAIEHPKLKHLSLSKLLVKEGNPDLLRKSGQAGNISAETIKKVTKNPYYNDK